MLKKAASDSVWNDKAFNITKNPKYDTYKSELPSMVYKFGDFTHNGRGINPEHQKVADELRQLLENLKSLRNTLKNIVWSCKLSWYVNNK